MSEQYRHDIAAAADRMGSSIGSKRELQVLESHLQAGEEVAALAAGRHGPGNGLLVLTNQRLFFLFDGLIRKDFVDVALDSVTAVEWDTGLNLGTLTIQAGGEVAVAGIDKDAGAFFLTALKDATKLHRSI